MKRICFLIMPLFLYACGSSSGEKEETEPSPDRSAMSGKWSLNCYSDDADSLSWKTETISISEETFIFDWNYYHDSSCDPAGKYISFTDQGGEILAKEKMTSKNGYTFVRYTVIAQGLNSRSMDYSLHYSNDAIYKVEFDDDEYQNNQDIDAPQNYVVNFNKMYVRE